MSNTRAVKICLAASGGGHLRQLLDLQDYWEDKDFFFVTEETALATTLAEKWPVRFINHFAFGQAKLGAPLKMLTSGFNNFVTSWRIMREERPTHLISTGAGAVFFTVLLARMSGVKILVVESFARFDHPSLFFSLAAPLAQDIVVQAKPLLKFHPRAKLFDPLVVYGDERPPKRPLLFATVGATLPFDRMVKAVEAAKNAGAITEEVIIQTGVGGYVPKDLETHETLPFDMMQSLQSEADLVVCHGGTGSLITALRQGCKVVVMPRNPKHGEHYDNHQMDITAAFAARGLVSFAHGAEDLEQALAEARSRPVIFASTRQQPLIAYIKSLWGDL